MERPTGVRVRLFAKPAGHLLDDRLDTDLRYGNEPAIIDVVVVRMAGCHDQLQETGD